ncbi:MAG: hypothetical protein A3I32_01905 [Candidatus Yanofskybacteria bacterium RIFCSPLOWO2_02_FULL_45_10]|uniref:FtsK domain-containing protein n=1 Tax=Candidatus Yanofskybacteria bacterium RIFCSPLOWO2_02_FULL_45_10 TaxID=1802706 RepID=A0A1F8H2D1_9BACT|nr:MAG: hypothetical protein A3I32_01905 [Candidatus Yanofskybacteria bacterium RIFCSPLOWO2_02_FULL_45_10]
MDKNKSKKKDRNWNNNDKESKPLFDLSQETRNGIWAVFSFGLVVISLLSFFGKAGRAGQMFNALSKDLFGWGIFLLPLAFLLLGISFIKSVSRKIYASALTGTLFFILSILAIFFILGHGAFSDRLIQGGYLGAILGLPLLQAFGFTAAAIVLVLVLAISVSLALNLSIPGLFMKKPLAEGEVAPMGDKIVIKRGTEVLDAATEAREARERANRPVTVVKPVANNEDKEFVLKMSKGGKWTLPPIDLLHTDTDKPHSGDINAHVGIIKRTLSNFNIDVEMGEVSIGPTVTQYTLRPAVGVKLSKITTLSPDLSLALAAHPIRIEAPIPGKSLVGIEVPNKKFATVGLRNIIEGDEFKDSNALLPLGLGRDVAGFPVFANLEKMPHLLVAGATGTGKSVCINALILSMLYRHSPAVLKFIMIDPKRVELTMYNGIPHLITPVIVDPKRAVNALRWAVREMEKRYELVSATGSRDILSYNAKMVTKKEAIMPFIVIVIDELADLMMANGRDIESAIVRIAQMARAVGIHLIVSTQRPSVEVITGLIKANITSRIAFQVASLIDSRTILDGSGAEKLLGRGDMLFQAGDTAKPRRIQGSFVSEKEVRDVVKFVSAQAEEVDEETIEEQTAGGAKLEIDMDKEVSESMAVDGGEEGDTLYQEAKAVVIQAGKASASLLQRRLKVGYARAARLLDLLEENGIIGPGEGAKPREVFVRPSVDIALPELRPESLGDGFQRPDNSGTGTPSNDDGATAEEARNDDII